jgi:hypothetical protein
MAKQQHKTNTSGTSGAGAAAAREVKPVAKASKPIVPAKDSVALGSTPEPEQIARLAYSYWQALGCPKGSSEEDWFRAESELRRQTARTPTKTPSSPRPRKSRA